MINISTLSLLSGTARGYDRHVWHCFVFGMVTTTETIIISKILSNMYDNVLTMGITTVRTIVMMIMIEHDTKDQEQ